MPADTDQTCDRCGYALIGLPPDGDCPECGLAIAASRRRQGDEAALARLGLRMGIALFLIGGVVSYIVSVAMLGEGVPSERRSALTGMTLGVVGPRVSVLLLGIEKSSRLVYEVGSQLPLILSGPFLSTLGIWLATIGEPGETRWNTTWRWSSRLASALLVGGMIGLMPFGFMAYSSDDLPAVRGWLVLLVDLPVTVLFLTYLAETARPARRGARPRLLPALVGAVVAAQGVLILADGFANRRGIAALGFFNGEPAATGLIRIAMGAACLGASVWASSVLLRIVVRPRPIDAT